jgi:hypothetical protein
MMSIFRKIGILAVAVLLVVLANSFLSLEAQNRATPNRERPVLKFPRLTTDTPIRRSQAASRSNSMSLDNKQIRDRIIALSPDESIALTTSSHPTFWIYLPAVSGKGEFVLQSRDNFSDLYRTPITLPSTPGVISITSPPQPQYTLETEKLYIWYFKVYPDPSDIKNYWYVSGAVQRKVEKLSASKEHTTHVTSGMWQDALTTVANLYRNNPNDTKLKDEWSELLQAVGLSELAQAPILSCCTPQK